MTDQENQSSETDEPMPRHLRTPITEAGSAISAACDWWIDLCANIKPENISDPEDFFFEKAFESAWDNPEEDGQKHINELLSNVEYESNFALLHVMNAVVAFSVQAMKAEQDGRHNDAWTYAVDAKYWAGILKAAWADKKHSNPASELARRRHAENYALAQEAIKYWEQNIDPSLSAQKAATELDRAGVVPLSHKKIAEIIAAERRRRQ
ncbi:hypothetical protein [Allochromatium vinosum]|uniref:hypothetical protein n=1 Tax=Allochromatium vinosum TaxID=1049 RepID=UPI001905D28E|nr:hypothetical protein [Allochromatium vinosum]